jgi:precorrin-2/cobalt-factor-2 C20-methyltransferase
MNNEKTGTLYGIGVGPGDPDLITMKAVKILKKVDVIFAAASSKNQHSQAVNIAKSYIPETTEIAMLPFPMTQDKSVAQKAWDEHARNIIALLEQGQDAAFVTLGDSMIYATYGYILQSVQRLAPHLNIVSIPGVTSFQAAAARLNRTLVEGEESLLLLSGVNGGDRLRRFAGKAENVAILKAYRKVKDIVSALDETRMMENSIAITSCGLSDEEIIEDIRTLEKRTPAYWTLILAKGTKKNG